MNSPIQSPLPACGERVAEGRVRGAILTAVLLLAPAIASACPVCFGDPNSAMTKGTNNGVFFLLGIIGFVQIGLGAMFIAFWRRARALRARRDSMRVINGGFFG
ncbi:MAG TPA: hypothetical protein VI670_18925 [Thermoanaerobaculia bacterium]